MTKLDCNPFLFFGFFHRTLQLLMMYHHTKFGNKRLSSSEDIVQILTEILNKLKFGTFTVTQGHSNPIFITGHFSLWYSAISLSLVAKEASVQKTYSKNGSTLLLYKPLVWPRPWRQHPIRFCTTVQLMTLHHQGCTSTLDTVIHWQSLQNVHLLSQWRGQMSHYVLVSVAIGWLF